MAKYIDAEKLKRLVGELKKQAERDHCDTWGIVPDALEEVEGFITSLQQEQTENSKGKFVFPKFLYARTMDNKTIDVSYCPQDMTAIEYVRNDFVEQGQPKVDLEEEIDHYMYLIQPWEVQKAPCTSLENCAHYFFELGMSVMRERITNSDYNQNVIEKIKSEYPMDETNARKEE